MFLIQASGRSGVKLNPLAEVRMFWLMRLVAHLRCGCR